MSKYYQGKFKPKNKHKYKGDIDNIWYRSSWELHVFSWLDTESSVLEWSSEEVTIPYLSPIDSRWHRYFPDIRAKFKTKNGVQEFIIEIKPYSQTIPPKTPKRKTKRFLQQVMEYSKNQAKWEYATKWANAQGMQFKVLTEKEIYKNTK